MTLQTREDWRSWLRALRPAALLFGALLVLDELLKKWPNLSPNLLLLRKA